MLGKAGNSSEILKRTPSIIAEFRKLKGLLEPAGASAKKEGWISDREIYEKMNMIIEAVSDFNLGLMDEIIEELNEHEPPEKVKDMLEKLMESADNIDYDAVEEFAKKIQEAVK